MELLDRYLQAIKPLLPRKAQDDILRELSDDIVTQMEEKEATLGRPLKEEEQEEIIRRYGHPVVVAARYGRAHYLIGPSLFPFYWLILKIAAVGALIVRWIIAMVAIAMSPHPTAAVAPEILSVPFVLVPVFAWVTGGFAIAELCVSRLDLKMKGGWSPRSLPAVTRQLLDVPRASSVPTIVFGSLFIVFWQSLPATPSLALGPGLGVLSLGTIWNTLHWPILLLAAAGVVQAIINLVRPQLTPARIVAHLLTQVYALTLLCILWAAGNWVTASPELGNPARHASAIGVLNQAILWCIACAVGITVVQIALEWRKYGPRLAHGCSAKHKLRSA